METIWMTSGQVATLAETSISTVNNWADSGLLPFHRAGAGRRRRFRRDEVVTFLATTYARESAKGESA